MRYKFNHNFTKKYKIICTKTVLHPFITYNEILLGVDTGFFFHFLDFTFNSLTPTFKAHHRLVKLLISVIKFNHIKIRISETSKKLREGNCS